MVKSPLKKRHLREIRSDLGKYLTIFLLLLLSISEICGFLVADESMIAAYEESFEKYHIENGNFTSEKQLSARQIKAIEAEGVQVCDLYFTDRPLTNGSTIRIFKNRDRVNLVCLMEGKLPENEDEIAIDRMYADNNALQVGDSITDAGNEKTYRITGLVALSDYSCLFEDNGDMMFDAKQFGVSIVTEEAFAAYDRDLLTWRYAWTYDDPPQDESEENERSEELMKRLAGIISMTDYVPRYQNQAINFTGEDMGGDRAMMTILLYMVIVIIAFVFGITINNTIQQEATVIGTLRATGYTRGELIRHYMAMPFIITLIAAILGNILGYTILKDINADLYYGSYSLPTYVTVWSAEAFIETTVIPLILMVLITFLVLHQKLKLSPLQFLRRDLRKNRKRGAICLSKHIPFFSRFRLRIFFQNFGNYVVLFVGILFANMLLLFGLMFPSVLGNYMEAIPDNMISTYQYILQIPANALREDHKTESMVELLMFQEAVKTENESAEKFSAYALRTIADSWHRSEEISLYGVAADSAYVKLPFKDREEGIYVSTSLAEKWQLAPGDSLRLKEAYEDTTYSFDLKGIYDYSGALCVFMNMETLNATFDLGEGTYAGYFADSEITDIDQKYISQVIDFEALTKISRQLDISMGGMMRVVQLFAVLMYLILVYLLSKTIIEKNAQSISLTKILGYKNGEIARLYIMVTSLLVFLFMIVTIPLIVWALGKILYIAIRMEMAGWIPYMLGSDVFVKEVLSGTLAYAFVAVLEYRKITHVPMEEALKNVE